MSDEPSAPQVTPADIAAIHARLDKGAARMDAMQEGMDEMKVELSANTKVTTEVRDLLETWKGGIRFAGWLGAFVKWVGGVAAAAVGLWALFHGGQPPTKP